jgi:hypothetical protein
MWVQVSSLDVDIAASGRNAVRGTYLQAFADFFVVHVFSVNKEVRHMSYMNPAPIL